MFFDIFFLTLNVIYDEKQNIFNDLLKQDETNSYWYVELGQVFSSVATKRKWRYVGDYTTSFDGTETFARYTYSTTKPTIGSGSVFVQETALTSSTTTSKQHTKKHTHCVFWCVVFSKKYNKIET